MKKFAERNGNENFKKSLSGVEEFYALVETAARTTSASIKPDFLTNEIDYEIVRKYFRFLYSQYAVKYAELTGALIDAANERQYLVFALCGRSLLELTATLRYYIRKLQPIIDQSVTTGFLTHEQLREMVELLDQHARGGKFNWNEFYFGDRSELASRLFKERKKKKQAEIGRNSRLEQTNPNQVHINKAFDNWAKDEPGILLFYGYFCELVHPNLGSNFLVMGSKEGRLVIGENSPKDVAESLYIEGLPMIASSAIRDGSQYMSVLMLLKETEAARPYEDGA